MHFIVVAFALFLMEFVKSQTVLGPCIGGSCPSPAVCLTSIDQCVVFATTAASPVVTCVDLAAPGKASTCPGQGYLCQNALYRELMKVQCPKTCGYCT